MEDKISLLDEINDETNDESMVDQVDPSVPQAFDKAIENYRLNNYNAALELFKQSAEKGNADAQYHLAKCLEHGKGVEKNIEEALKYYRQAAEGGNAEAIFSIGQCLENKGDLTSLEDSVRYYKSAVIKGISKAKKRLAIVFNRMAIMSSKGKESDVNHKKAYRYFLESARLGNISGQYNLYLCYKYGIGIDKNPNLEDETLRRAADNGHMLAQFLYALQLEEIDQAEAVRYYQLSVEQDYAPAEYNLALHYNYGSKAVKQDFAKAAQLYEKAAEQNVPEASYNLALLYKNAQGVERNLEKSFNLFKKSADLGFSRGIFSLALCYEHGTFVEKDMTMAIKYYMLAAQKGDDAAQYNLALCYKDGFGVAENPEESFRLFSEAAKSNNPDALLQLAICYHEGYGVSEDIGKAFELYRQSADGGNSEAKYILHLYSSDEEKSFIDENFSEQKLRENHYSENHVATKISTATETKANHEIKFMNETEFAEIFGQDISPLDENIKRRLVFAVSPDNHSEDLNLLSSGIDDVCAKLIAKILKKTTNIKNIFLDSNLISDSGIKSVAKALRKNKFIENIGFSGNLISDDGARYVAKMLSKNANIRKISLSGNVIGDAGLRYLADALKANSSIEKLDLSFNKILGYEGIKAKEEIDKYLERNSRINNISKKSTRITHNDEVKTENRVPTLNLPEENNVKSFANLLDFDESLA